MVFLRLQIVLFLFVLAQAGNACSLVRYDYCKIAIGKKSELHSTKNLHSDSGHELPGFKRKYRTKGIQVIMPLISTLSFYNFYKPGEYMVPKVQNSGTFVIHYVQGKRGPPAV